MLGSKPFKDDLMSLQSLARPLIYRNGKSEDEIAKEYSKFFSEYTSLAEKNEKRMWDLFAQLYSKTPKINPRYESIAKLNPELNKPIVFLQWLEEQYAIDNQKPQSEENVPFYYVRTGKYQEYFEQLKNFDKNKAAYIAGAIEYQQTPSSPNFKSWRTAALILTPDDEVEKELYHILAGDRAFLEARTATSFDKMWVEMTVLLTNALAGDPYNIQTVIESLTEPDLPFPRTILHILRDKRDEIPNDENLSLRFRIHASAILGNPNREIMEEFIEPYLEKRFIGLVFLYCSLLKEEDAVNVLSKVLGGLPSPDTAALKTMHRFSIPPNKVIEKAVDQVIEAERDDFADDMADDEFVQKKIDIIGWLDAACMENMAERKVRKLLTYFALKKDFKSCSLLLKSKGYMLTDKNEVDSWNYLIVAELHPTIENLKALINFKGGWMQGCEVEERLMQFVIPLVANQLLDAFIAEGGVYSPLVAFGMICYPPKNFSRYIPKEEALKLLLKAKEVAIHLEEESEKQKI